MKHLLIILLLFPLFALGQNFGVTGGNFFITAPTTGITGNLTITTGDLGLTGSRVTKGWFTNLESTNSITINGSALSSIYQPLHASLTSISGLTEAAGTLIYGTADNAYAILPAGATTTVLVGGGAAAPVWTTATGTGAPVRAGSPTFTTQITTPKVITSGNNGTANTGVTAVEYGDGYQHTTILTVSQVDALTTADLASIADGYLLYTFPAGAIIINYAYMSMGMTATTEQLGDTPDVGLGTVIATGAVDLLNGTATFENIITGQTAVANGTAEIKTALPTAGVPFIIESGDAHTIHFNVADAWADDTSTDLTANIAGTVVIVWSFIN